MICHSLLNVRTSNDIQLLIVGIMVVRVLRDFDEEDVMVTKWFTSTVFVLIL